VWLGYDLVGGQKKVEVARSKTSKVRRVIFSPPSTFMVYVIGVVLTFVRRHELVNEIKFGPSSIEVKFSKHAWKKGFVKGAIPQHPLSILNFVVSRNWVYLCNN